MEPGMSASDTLSRPVAPVRDPFAYEARALIADPVVPVGGCRFKPYRIAHAGPGGLAAVQAHSMLALLTAGAPDLEETGNHDLGFAMLHQGRDGAYLLIARWNGGHNLGSRTYRITGPTPGLQPLSLLACVWELAVYAQERAIWVRTMMASGRGLAGAEAYLASRAEGPL